MDDIKVQFIAPERWWKRAKWQLLEDYVSANGNVVASAGFITDGASIPWLLRPFFSPTGKYFGAAIVHDYLLEIGAGWDRANKEFNDEMKALSVASIRRNLILGSVNLWGNTKQLFTELFNI